MLRKAIPKRTVKICGLQFYKGEKCKLWYDILRDRCRVECYGTERHLMMDRELFEKYFKVEEQP